MVDLRDDIDQGLGQARHAVEVLVRHVVLDCFTKNLMATLQLGQTIVSFFPEKW